MRNFAIALAMMLAVCGLAWAQGETVWVPSLNNGHGGWEAVCGTDNGNGTANFCSGGSSGNAAAGPTGSAVPSSASLTGFQNPSGNLTAVSAANPLPFTASSLPLPTNAASAAGQNPTLADTTTEPSVSVGTTSVAVVAASTNTRARVVLYNTSTSVPVWCRSDGGTAALNTGVLLPVGGSGGYQWNYPGVGNAAINCIAIGGTATVAGEAVQ